MPNPHQSMSHWIDPQPVRPGRSAKVETIAFSGTHSTILLGSLFLGVFLFGIALFALGN